MYAYAADPDALGHYSVFHLGLRCSQKNILGCTLNKGLSTTYYFFLRFFTSNSTIFQLCREGPSRVETVLCLAPEHNAVTPLCS